MKGKTGRYLILGMCLIVMALAQPLGAAVIEGFESGDLALYNITSNSNFTVNATAKHDGNYGLFGSAYSDWIYRTDAGVSLQQGDSFSAWLLRTEAGYGRSYLGFGASNSGCYSAVIAPNTDEFIIQLNQSYGFNDLNAVSQTYQANHWYKVAVDWGVGGLITAYLYDSDGVTLLNSVSTTDTTYTAGGIAFRGFEGDYYFDTYERVGAAPLPGTLVLLGSGLVGLLGWRRLR